MTVIRHGIHKLFRYLELAMSKSLVKWRLVIGRFGRLGHGELKGEHTFILKFDIFSCFSQVFSSRTLIMCHCFTKLFSPFFLIYIAVYLFNGVWFFRAACVALNDAFWCSITCNHTINVLWRFLHFRIRFGFLSWQLFSIACIKLKCVHFRVVKTAE